MQLSVPDRALKDTLIFLGSEPLLATGVIDEIYGNTVTMHLSPSPPLSKLFELIEEYRSKLEIQFYSVTQCTLEQVFIAIASASIAVTTKHEEVAHAFNIGIRSPRAPFAPDAALNVTPRTVRPMSP